MRAYRSYDGCITDENNGFRQNVAVLQADVFIYCMTVWRPRSRRSCQRKITFPWEALSYWVQKPTGQKKRLKRSAFFLLICIVFSETSEYGSWLQIPILPLLVACIMSLMCCRNVYARLLNNRYLSTSGFLRGHKSSMQSSYHTIRRIYVNFPVRTYNPRKAIWQ